MDNDQLYKQHYNRLASSDIFRKDFPEEDTASTISALWHTAAGKTGFPADSTISQLPDLSEQQELTLEKLVAQRLSGTPLAYLTGHTRFMGLEFICEPGVLIPRIETELLASTVISILSKNRDDSEEVIGLDVGCGCGNLSCSIASSVPHTKIHAIDITDECVTLTRKNITALNLKKNITPHKGNLFTPVKNLHLEGMVDFVVSNPPYIPKAKLQSDLGHLTNHEPEEAFNGGIYGFSIHQKLIRESLIYLKPGGFLAFEFGIGQEKQVETLFRRVKGYTPAEFREDKNNVPRVIVVQKN